MAGDACVTGWFGVKCDPTNTHVVQLFPNTRFSGNALEGCQLPASIGNLANLEHLYMSNDRTPSHLVGPIPATVGKLTRLKCMYFSHTGVSGTLPRELENLVNLEVFLVRANNLTGQQGARQNKPKKTNTGACAVFWCFAGFAARGVPYWWSTWTGHCTCWVLGGVDEAYVIGLIGRRSQGRRLATGACLVVSCMLWCQARWSTSPSCRTSRTCGSTRRT